METHSNTRLGRGLDALLDAGSPPASSTARLDRIRENPYQPRKRFDEDDLKQLTASVKVHGVLQPVVVRDAGDHYQLIAGERRVRAAQLAGLDVVPVHVVNFDDRQVYEAALAENIQRSDLNPIEKALGFKDYMTRYEATTEQLGKQLGIDRSTVSHYAGLLNLPADVQDLVRSGQVSFAHAKVLKGVATADEQSRVAKRVVLEGISVAALDAMVKAEKARRQAEKEAAAAGADAAPAGESDAGKSTKTEHVLSLENELRQRLSLKVEIKVKAKEKGSIVIGFETSDDFDRILEALRK